MNFTKMTGLGNDYVYVDGTVQTISDPSKLAKKVSDRHFGIGSDGLILLKKGTNAYYRMEMYNADGTRAQMCGNGLRCIAWYIYSRKRINRTSFPIETDAGVFKVEVEPHTEEFAQVHTALGTPNFSAISVPVVGFGADAMLESLRLPEQTIIFSAVNMGNPHCVIRLPEENSVYLDDYPVEIIGPQIERHKQFPKRTNVEFIVITDEQTVYQRTWERGTGETMACGTGAAASLAVGHKLGLLDTHIKCHLKGGVLELNWDKDQNMIFQKGPAQFVFDGMLHSNEYFAI